MKCNVDLLKVIQIGLTLSDGKGGLPHESGEYPYSSWQFNFSFDVSNDLHSSDSITFLQGNGVDFDTHAQQGVDVTVFGELLMASGLVLNEDVRWIAFQGKYDFAYLVKVLTCDHLPHKMDQFVDLLSTYFPTLYDLKWITHVIHRQGIEEAEDGGMRVKDKGLEDLAESLGVARVGRAHQAGSDSLITSRAFFALVKAYLPGLLNGNAGVMELRGLDSASEGEGLGGGSPGKKLVEMKIDKLSNILHGIGKGFIRPDRDGGGGEREKEEISDPPAPRVLPPPPAIPPPPAPRFPPVAGAVRLLAPA